MFVIIPGDCGSGWMMNRVRDGTKFYFNVITRDYSLERLDSIKKDYSLVTRDEIQVSSQQFFNNLYQ